MEQILEALSGLMVKAIPTIAFFIFVYYFLKIMLFVPLAKVLKQREELTAGARKSAETSLKTADRKQQEYEEKFNEARSEVYKSQEETRRKWLDDQSKAVEAARAEAGAGVLAAREKLATDAATARENLATTAGELADEIAGAVLSRKAGSAA